MPVRILTLVTNGRGGTGPGHSALAVGSQVYTFGGGGATEWEATPVEAQAGGKHSGTNRI